MSIRVNKKLKGDAWVISRQKDGFTKQISIDFQELRILHKRLGDILKMKIKL